MSDNNAFGFGKLVPGFDFLQNLGKGAAQGMAQMPNLSSWIAPTLNVEDLDKRISELKTVQFWLEQNGKALAATIQALEVQKMTLATLKGMNFSMGEMAESLKLRPQASPAAADASAARPPTAEPAARAPRKAARAKPRAAQEAAAAKTGGVVDPMQWWGALTQQFQQIASHAMKDATAQKAPKTPNAAADAGTATPSTPARKSRLAGAARKR